MNVSKCNTYGKTMFTALPCETCLACSQVPMPPHTAEEALSCLADSSPPPSVPEAPSGGDVGKMAHRGNTVDYIYDKARVYGNQVGWLAGRMERIRKIVEEPWEGSEAQEFLKRHAEEVNALRTELSQATNKMNALRESNARLAGRIVAAEKERDAAREELKAAKGEAARYREALEALLTDIEKEYGPELYLVRGNRALKQARAALSPVAEEEGGENG